MFQKFDFQQLNSPDFKEDAVREVLILPIIQRLGYAQKQIVRSKSLAHPFIKIGSKKRPILLVPDYLLQIEENYAWVLDAKAPNENITDGGNVEQVFSYATHPEIRTKYFALCNGREFALFRTDEQKPFLYFLLQDIENYWEQLERYLSPDSFQAGKSFTLPTLTPTKKDTFDYLNRPLLEEISTKKQAAKRHFGITSYFTRQTWNVVQEYIRNFTKVGDVVLDSFGGSGVTAIEALMTDRKAIHIDLNPLSVFMVEALIVPVKISDLQTTFERIKNAYEKSNLLNFDSLTKKEQEEILKKYPYPTNLPLPKGSDVKSIEQLFSPAQLAQLAYLKYLIKQEKNKNIQKSLFLAFYNTLSICNLTFHSTPKGGGNHFGFYYRYRLAKKPTFNNIMNVFERKFDRILVGKKEIEYNINENTIQNIQILKGTATDLSFLKKESVDYIYTDPPYGKKIPYLDLSTMWNGWLDLEVTEEDFEMEAIEGGEHHKTKDSYNQLIKKSIEELYRVLKFDRWMSFVFAHKDPEFWHLIIETAEKCGFEYAGAVSQNNGQTSFKKRQNSHTILAGQLIINFKKTRRPKSILQANLGMEISEIVLQTIEGVIAKNNGSNLEKINDEIIIKGLELGFMHLIPNVYADLTDYLLDKFEYDHDTKLFKIRQNRKFNSYIDLNLRVRYYLISYLRRMELEKKLASFDEIILHIIPLLKNGTTPEKQTVLNVLEQIAERVGADSWQLRKEGQQSIFE